MKTQMNFFRAVLVVALVTCALLMIPFVAMQVGDEVNWSVGDFIIMGLLLFSIGFSYVFITRKATTLAFKMGVIGGLGTTFLMIWANLGVGLIGSGPNAANLLYMAVPVIGLVGVVLSQFSATGMERTMYAMATGLVVVGGIATALGVHHLPGASVTEIIGVSGFFGLLYLISGLFFRYAAQERRSNAGSAGSTAA